MASIKAPTPPQPSSKETQRRIQKELGVSKQNNCYLLDEGCYNFKYLGQMWLTGDSPIYLIQLSHGRPILGATTTYYIE